MRFQQGKMSNEYGIAETEDPHVDMSEACREEYNVKGS